MSRRATEMRLAHKAVLMAALESRLLMADHFPTTGSEFQTALNNAQLGDNIVLQAGTTYTGSFTLPNKTSGSGWIRIVSSALGALPAEGVRVSPADAANMPKLVSQGGNAQVIKTAAAAHHYQFVGIEFIAPANNSALVTLIEFGTSSSTQDTLAEVPHHLNIDRCYIRANSPTQLFRRAIALHSAQSNITNSWIAEVHDQGAADSQAIAGWNGPGPYNIINNHLEAASENIMFGGSTMHIANVVPSDIVIRGNHIIKPLSWKGVWAVKNLFEIKTARRVLLEGNVLENCWVSGQTGPAIVLKTNLDAAWASTDDITIVNNVIRHAAGGFQLQGLDYISNGGHLWNVTIRNNVFDDIGTSFWGSNGRLFQITDSPKNITIDHNTAFHTGTVIPMDAKVSNGLVFTNNLFPHNQYGIKADGQGVGNTTINAYLPDSIINKNVLMGGSASLYTSRPGNFFPANWGAVNFVDQAGGNYRLAPASPYNNAGTDGKDVGADIDLVDAATLGAISGSWPFAWQVGGQMFVNFDGTGAAITLGTSGSNITATKGAQTLNFSNVTDIHSYDSTGTETLFVNAPLTPVLSTHLSAGDDLLQVNTGTLNVNQDIGNHLQTLAVHVVGGATVNFGASQRLRSVSVDGTMNLTAGGSKVLRVTDMQVLGKLNLADNDLIWDYSAGSPIGAWAGSAYTGLTKLIADGRANGTWTGNGLITNQSNAQGTSPLTTLGVAESAGVLSLSAGQTGVFSGVTVDDTAVLVKYTYSPDANLSGNIDGDDFFLIDNAYTANSPRSYFTGDFNLDGKRDADDYFLIDSKVGRQTGSL